MIIPIRCCTCGKVLADKYEYYKEKSAEIDRKAKETPEAELKLTQLKFFDGAPKKELLDFLGLDRYCCRRHMLAHVDIIDNI